MEQPRTYTHLSPEERAVIMLELHRAREDNRPCSIRALARALNRNPSTISRELRRLGDPVESPEGTSPSGAHGTGRERLRSSGSSGNPPIFDRHQK